MYVFEGGLLRQDCGARGNKLKKEVAAVASHYRRVSVRLLSDVRARWPQRRTEQCIFRCEMNLAYFSE